MERILLTPDIVKSIWSYLSTCLNSRIRSKRSSVVMRVAAFFVARFSPMTKDEFYDRYATTIFRTIYLPFEVGELSTTWGPLRQFKLAVHEHQHIVQAKRDGWIRYSWRYLRSTRARALYEAECLLCEYACAARLGVSMAPPHQSAAELRSYGVTDADVAAAQEFLESRLAAMHAFPAMERDHMPTAARLMLVHLALDLHLPIP